MKILGWIFIIGFATLFCLVGNTHWRGPYLASPSLTIKKRDITARANTYATGAARNGYYMCSTWVKGKGGKPDSSYFAKGPKNGRSIKRGNGRNLANCFADATIYGYNVQGAHYHDSHSKP